MRIINFSLAMLTSMSLWATNEGSDTLKSTQEIINSNFEVNLDSLINLYAAQDTLLADTNGLIVLSNEDTSRIISSVTDEIYIERIAAIPTIVKLQYNRIVRNYIEMYINRKTDRLQLMLGLSEYYFPIFDDIFDYYGVPHEMKYMSIIESALNPRAYSRARAVGLWQFMYTTGRMYGLEANSLVDERMDPVKATHAAARYIYDLHKEFNGDWILALAAYNCGPGNVRKAIRRAGGRTDYWEIYYYLPKETRGHIPAFIAANYIMNYYKEHNLKPAAINLPLKTDTVHIIRQLHLAQVSEMLNIPMTLLRDMNPQYRKDYIPATNRAYPLRLPEDAIDQFIDQEQEIYAYKDSIYLNQAKIEATVAQGTTHFAYEPPSDKYAKLYYTVKSGDNLGYIADWYNVSLSNLRSWNGIRKNMIRAGQRLTVYVPRSKYNHYSRINKMSFSEKQKLSGKAVADDKPAMVTASTPQTDTNLTAGDYITYRIRPGDTIWDIAQKHDGVSTTDILRLNNLSKYDKIVPGQVIKIKKRG